MRYIFITLLFLCFKGIAQTNNYNISFENAVHHEAKIKASFPKIKTGKLKLRMSRTSPGRYALHEFAKNVYGLKATNSKGEALPISRPDPYSWIVSGHDGTVNIEYILYANRGDGTYSQIDETHAHLNIPATFIYSEELKHRPIEVNFDVREDLNWKIATQLEKLSQNKYSAPDLYYFMDSPVEISDHDVKEFELQGKKIQFVLHHPGTDTEFEEYFDQVIRIVKQETAVFGELPDYDYGKYTFLACYMPNVSGDGMEHRNSTILTDIESLADGGMKGNIGTVAHEFFHGWNVERLRPEDLEPFSFSEVNMSEGLWFAEGFTSYYTGLILCRAQVNSEKEYIEGLAGTFNYVWNSPAREYFNPIQMSMQAPFIDAATSVDPVNRENTFISYYSYGSSLGLALDLSLKQNDLNLDDFMKLMWTKYGKKEIAYDVKDIEETLIEYAGPEFGTKFFQEYIHSSKMPDYKNLMKSVGVKLEQETNENYFGATLKNTENGLEITRNTFKNSPAYKAGLDHGDLITSVNGEPITSVEDFNKLIKNSKKNAVIEIGFERFGKPKITEVKLGSDPHYKISLMEKAEKQQLKNRKQWLDAK
ncbi:M61 family metallopeptidase [Christiangramia salexigens]|uniref:Peptidase M61 n=1 Tax=Christiangramia salexigens TaxID=1913577 RepID=A0A1L3J665_9FLAO|nr:PDZ domain-containing protein [Christiangramia salexigens]APG60594.1 peptidase M61 [Christiangramia salexigens]